MDIWEILARMTCAELQAQLVDYRRNLDRDAVRLAAMESAAKSRRRCCWSKSELEDLERLEALSG